MLAYLSLVLLAGVMNGTFAVPMKYARRWSWENIWLAWSFLALVVFPLVLTVTTVPSLAQIYSSSPMAILSVIFAFGVGWGISQVLFGLGIDRVGVAVGFAIVVGLAAALGSLVPLLVFHAGRVGSAYGLGAIAAVCVIIAGVALCAWAGKMKDLETSSGSLSDGKPPKSKWGILLCVLSGIGGSMINLGWAFGTPVVDLARRREISPLYQANVVWFPLLLAGSIPSSIYCFRLLQSNHTWPLYLKRDCLTHWALVILMAVLWLGSVELYGVVTGQMGNWGPVLGWPVFMSSAIVTASVWGVVTGEWKTASSRARRFMFGGVAVLVAAIFLLGIVGKLR